MSDEADVQAVPAAVRPAPLFVIHGDASEEEIAALTTVLVSALASPQATATPAEPTSTWADPARRVNAPLLPGNGSWRASALPR